MDTNLSISLRRTEGLSFHTPLLTTASPSEPLSLYLSASNAAVGAVLIKDEGGQQQPIYYVSQVLKDVETRYPSVEKFAVCPGHGK